MQNEAEVLLVLFLSFPVTFSQQNRLKSVGKVQRVAKLGDILVTMVYFQSLVRGEIVYQNQRINENLEDIIVKDVNQHLYSTHTKYEQKQTNTKVVWCMHSNPSSKPRVGPAYHRDTIPLEALRGKVVRCYYNIMPPLLLLLL